MGSYLSRPSTEKLSTDGSDGKLICGASSMQGWRLNQEDAHNCLLDFDADTSLFAVYDGHGGHEVAQYCSAKLPDFIKSTESYRSGDLEAALVDAFLGFDRTITTQEVIDELKAIAGESTSEETKYELRDEEENVWHLYEEAAMPIEQVIEKYAKNLKKGDEKTSENDSVVGTSSGSSCSYRQQKDTETANDGVSSSSNVVNEPSSANHVEGDVSEANGVEEASAASPDSSDVKEVITSSKSDVKLGEPESSVNGDASTPDESVKSDVSSSSNVQENGSKKGKGKALNKTKGVIVNERPNVEGKRQTRNANQLYKQLLDFEESDEYSEDEEDKTFEGPYDGTSEEEENGVNAAIENSDSSEGEEEEEEDEEDDEEEEDVEDLEFQQNKKEEPGSDSGCTAVVALLRGEELYVANAGDSRCVVCRKGQAVEMSFDHKPEDEAERERIEKAGGWISPDGRVNSGLNLSRAIGDHAYKQNKELSDKEQMITALPDVKRLTINPTEDEFMVLACDGIWNFMSSQNVVDFVRERIEKADKLSKICEELFDNCLAPHTRGDGTGCDNMTAIIVQFKSSGLKRPASPFPESTESDSKRTKTEESDAQIDTTA